MERSPKARRTGTALVMAACARAYPVARAGQNFVLSFAFALFLSCGAVWAQSYRAGYARIGWVGQHGARMQQPTQHLPQWFQQHQSMPPQAQQRALRKEPGYRRLPPEEQRRISDRLRQLDAMPPAQRQRTLQRVETWERLTPTQRRQVRTAVQQVSRLPYPRQQMLHKKFRDLCRMPPDQRAAEMNSPQFRSEFSDHERGMLSTLMSIQPYTPPRQVGGYTPRP
jgi:Protein of unknown function (DUF3106)